MNPVNKGVSLYLAWVARVVDYAPGYMIMALIAWWFMAASGNDTAVVIALIAVLAPPLLAIVSTCLQHRASRDALTPDEAAMAWVSAPLRGPLLVLEHQLVAESALDDPTLLAAHRAEHGCDVGLPAPVEAWGSLTDEVRKVAAARRGERTTLGYFLREHGMTGGSLMKIVSADGTGRTASYVAPDGWTFELDQVPSGPTGGERKGWMRAP